MLKKSLSGDPFEFKLDRLEDTLALEGRGAGKSFFDQVCEQLLIRKIVRLRRYKEAPWSVDLENEEGVDSGGPGRETFAKVWGEVMMPQLGLFVQPPNDRIRDGRRQNVLIPVLEGPDACLPYVGALMSAAMIPTQPQQFRFSRFVWRFLRDAEIAVADLSELDDAMREAITSVRQAKTAETSPTWSSSSSPATGTGTRSSCPRTAR
jgi:hypothetical protein